MPFGGMEDKEIKTISLEAVTKLTIILVPFYFRPVCVLYIPELKKNTCVFYWMVGRKRFSFLLVVISREAEPS